jgi:hypothetical protein
MNLDEVSTIAILGDRHTAKTNLAVKLIRDYVKNGGQRKVYTYAYPKDLGYEQIYTIGQLEMLQDAIVFMDELQKHIKFYQKRTSDSFLELLSILAHNRITLIFTTPMSQFITKSLDCFITGFIYTRIADLDQLKNGSKAKRMLREFSTNRLGTRTLRLQNGEYLQIVDGQERTNGVKAFENQNVGKDWGNAN